MNQISLYIYKDQFNHMHGSWPKVDILALSLINGNSRFRCRIQGFAANLVSLITSITGTWMTLDDVRAMLPLIHKHVFVFKIDVSHQHIITELFSGISYLKTVY